MLRTCSGVTVVERGRSSWVIVEDWADVHGFISRLFLVQRIEELFKDESLESIE